MKFTISNITKIISNIPEEIRFNKLKKQSTSADFTDFLELAECYYKGIGTRRNYSQALKWYIKDAETGNAETQYNLGLCYWEGKKLVGGEKKEEEAFFWIEKAADSGHSMAKAFIDENKYSDPIKTQKLIDNFVFSELDKTIKFVKKIQDLNKRDLFVRKAIAYYSEVTTIQDVIPLIDYIYDQNYRIYVLLKYKSNPNVSALFDKYESETANIKDFKLGVAKAYEKLGDMYNASINYFKSYNNKEIGKFWMRWAQLSYENGQFFDANEKVQKAISYGEDATSLKQQIEYTIESRYSSNAFEVIERICDAEDIEQLSNIRNLSYESGLKNEYNKKMSEFILKEIDNVDSVEELAEFEGSAREYGIIDAYTDRLKCIIREEINSCIEINDILQLKETAVEHGLDSEFRQQMQEIIKDEMSSCMEVNELLQHKKIATEYNLANEYNRRMQEIIKEGIYLCRDINELLQLKDQAIDHNLEQYYNKTLAELKGDIEKKQEDNDINNEE